MGRQGKRSGKMVMGAMSSERYLTVVDKLPRGLDHYRTPENSDDLDCLDPFSPYRETVRYMAMRQRGMDHDEAFAVILDLWANPPKQYKKPD